MVSQRRRQHAKKVKRGRKSKPFFDSTNARERHIKQELVKLTRIVRNKFRDFRRDAENVERFFEASAVPLVAPLGKTVVEGIKQTLPDVKAIKKERQKERLIKKEASPTVDEEDYEEQDLNKTMDASIQTEPTLVEQYLGLLSSPKARNHIDSTYGLRTDGHNNLLIGDSTVYFTRSKLNVQNQKFTVTPGLMELLLMKVPEKEKITDDDFNNYKTILVLTNAHRQMYSADKPINSTKGTKYTSIIARLFPSSKRRVETPSTGSGIGDGVRSYTTNPNALVNRLRLLVLSEAAGHTAHHKEITEIIHLLRLHRIIL